jgi:hypothetical protein
MKSTKSKILNVLKEIQFMFSALSNIFFIAFSIVGIFMYPELAIYFVILLCISISGLTAILELDEIRIKEFCKQDEKNGN